MTSTAMHPWQVVISSSYTIIVATVNLVKLATGKGALVATK